MLSLALIVTALTPQPESSAALPLPPVEIVTRSEESALSTPVAVSSVQSDPDVPHARHAAELLTRVPSTWISRGSEQEQLTAIRSPVLTGSGACGAFGFLEYGIPIRPPGFCNVNNLFEVDTASASRIEVLRGPGSPAHGSNALHGAINVIPLGPESISRFHVAVGPYGYRELAARASWSDSVLSARGISSDSFRDNAGYDQQFVNVYSRVSPNADIFVSASNLNQETAGFIFGRNSFLDPDAARENVNPEAYRDAHSLRLGGRWTREYAGWDIGLQPFARTSRMEFLQHFLPGKPLERNGQDSLGLRFTANRSDSTGIWRTGVDIDAGTATLFQRQDSPTDGSAFLQETRPIGLHYDYQVDMATVGLFVQRQQLLAEKWLLDIGVRGEWTSYDYDNRFTDGNLRADGTACGFGGCLYTRPADRTDDFTDVAPKIALRFLPNDNTTVYARAARGFRAPQVTELYRLQNGQNVADLDSERLDSFELGYKKRGPGFFLDAAVYYAHKRNSIFRDAEGFNVSAGTSRHRGVEVESAVSLGHGWLLQGSLTYAIHTYGSFDAAEEIIAAGNEVDTAPRRLAGVQLSGPIGPLNFSLDGYRVGSYYTDAANENRYAGHGVWNLQAVWKPSGRVSLGLEVRNLLDNRYAERADFAFGNHRYFPGQDRSAYLQLTYTP